MGVVAWVLLGSGPASGNGGGFLRGGVRTTGGIAGFEPVATEHVRILDETLVIRAGRERAKVEVRYLMRNMTDKTVKVRFGFPIEESMDDNAYGPSAVAVVPHTSPKYCENYEITARGKPLRMVWQAEGNPEGDRWIWNFKDLEPTLEDDLEIECQPVENVFGGQPLAKEGTDGLPSHLYADYIERGGRWSMMHSNYEVKASSTLAPEGGIRYDATHVRDPWNDHVWSEGADGSGVGEWLELTPVAAKPLIGIHLKPGYQKKAKNDVSLFKANARPKSVRVELNGEHRFDAAIPDREEMVVIPVRGYDQPVRRIRLTFTGVYPGDFYEDLCVTSVKLHARLDREPKLQPQR